jgi:predicted PurR-regulated permease PerM
MSETGQHRIRMHDWRAIGRFIVYLVGLSILLALASWFYQKVFVAVFVAAFMAYLMNPLVDALEKRKVHRSVAGLMILTLIFGLVLWIGVRLFPFLYDQLVDLVQQVPSLVDNVAKNVGKYLRQLLSEYGIRDNGAVDKALKGFNIVEQLLSRIQMAAQGALDASAGIMGSLLSVILVPVLAFYFVTEKTSLVLALRRITPRDLRPYGKKVILIIDETLTNVIRGHIKVALALAALYSIGFSSIGLSAGVAIGIAAGICRIIPYLDMVVGLTLGVTYIFTQQLPTITVLWLVGIITLVQFLDGILITPRLIGSKVGLHPMVVILTVIAAGAQFGFWGVLLAIPAAALFKALYKKILPVYRDSHWFTGERLH